MTPEQIKLIKDIDNEPRACVKCGTTAPLISGAPLPVSPEMY